MFSPSATFTTLAPVPRARVPVASVIIVTVSSPVPPLIVWLTAPRVTLLVALARLSVSITESTV